MSPDERFPQFLRAFAKKSDVGEKLELAETTETLTVGTVLETDEAVSLLLLGIDSNLFIFYATSTEHRAEWFTAYRRSVLKKELCRNALHITGEI